MNTIPDQAVPSVPRDRDRPGSARADRDSGGVVTGGSVYLLHFDRPYKRARRYTGDLESSRFLKVLR